MRTPVPHKSRVRAATCVRGCMRALMHACRECKHHKKRGHGQCMPRTAPQQPGRPTDRYEFWRRRRKVRNRAWRRLCTRERRVASTRLVHVGPSCVGVSAPRAGSRQAQRMSARRHSTRRARLLQHRHALQVREEACVGELVARHGHDVADDREFAKCLCAACWGEGSWRACG